ncbi:polymorphic toxin-type HINT domain-containing protein [Streptomyces sp. NPDC091371]|uniref:polymorphic toxin-type HINT domain-containing protein n=1 Tax=Streptomyces sp. NPDC091371 TaxID=3155303 RepID=UPI003420BAED
MSLAQTALGSGPGDSSTLRVEVKNDAQTRAAGVNGALVALTDTGAASGVTPAGKVQVGLDVSAWAKSAGANWADRARLVQLPSCALTTPGAQGCTQRTPVETHRDGSGRLVAEVDVPKTPAAHLLKSPVGDGKAASAAAPQVLATQSVALAAEPGPSGASGDFTATPLLPSASWQAGSNAANFTYGYTVELPSTIAGPAPSLGLGYDSSSIDGRTASTNAQAGLFGEGWDWHPGSISRTYKSCKDAGIKDSGDECWAGDILSLNLAGHAGQIVRDDNSCVYRLQGEDGTKIERLTGQRNAAWKGEGFKVTTTDGTQYYFGANRLPGGDGTDPEAKSVSTVPVYFNSGQDKCLGADTPANGSWVQMGWQWNLDFVVDPHQNLIQYRYEQEGNFYGRGGGQNNGNGTLTAYQRGSYPTWIGYGQRLPDQLAAKGAAQPAAQVWLRTAERCFASGSITCDPSQRTKANAKSWPDTPVDQECAATGQCLNLSPTYFTTKRVTKIDTDVLDGTAYRTVDSYALNQSFQDPGDGTSPTLWLDSVQRTGSNGKNPLTLPAVSFQPLQIPNRVDGVVKRPDGTEASAPPYHRPRIQAITTETGGRINVVYKAPECSRLQNRMPSSEDGNTMACMPVKWYLPGQSYPDPVNDWFHKVVVQSITHQDLVAGQVSTVTEYEYGGGIAWHRNDSEFTDPKTRTWDQFRGFATVTTRTGSGSDGPRTKSVATFLRGMDGDVLANGGKRTVDVSDAQGGTIKDEDVLSGFVRQTQTYDGDGGNVVADEVSTPWLGAVTATRAQSGGMPPITARAMNTAKVTSRAKLANGTWRTSERTSTYDDTLATRPLKVDDWADTSRPDQRLCTTFEYAAAPGGAPTPLVSRTLILSGTCGQTPNRTNTVGDTRNYFDNLPLGQAGSTADQTGTEVLERYDGFGTPYYRLNSTSTYDAYGRVTSTTNHTRKDAAHPGGAVTTTEYKPAAGALPSEVTHTNPLGWKSVNTLDTGRSLPVRSTDENNHVAEREYDAFGRIVSVWQPGQERTKGFKPVRTFSYGMNGTNAPSTVLSRALMPDGQTYTSSYTIYDGIGRVRQTQANTASGVDGRLITDALFDSHGRQVKTSSAYYNDEALPSASLFLPNGGVMPDGKIPSQTYQIFDGLGRPTASVFQSYGVEQWRSKTEYPGADEVRSIPPNGGFASASITDGLGQRVALRQYKGNTPTGAYDETTYGYNAQGKELWRKDPAGNQWTFSYDLLGRTVQTTDPDAGTGTTVYDDAKNQVTVTDARGKTATTVSDLLGRTIATYEGAAVDPAKQVAGFTYDTKALGKPSSSTRYVGGASGQAYVSEVTGYDGGYRPLGSRTTIPASEGKLAGVYETANTYTELGILWKTKLPAIPAAGLGAETLTFKSNIVGNITALDGLIGSTLSPYLVDTRYDAYGRAIRSTVGRTGKQVVSTTDYDLATGAPIRSFLDKQTSAQASVDVIDYTYNQVGQLTSIGNTQDGTTRDLQCFTHDYLGRLTQAWTDTGTQTTAPQPSVRGIGGCSNAGGPAVDGTGKPSVGGPAPYWQQYEYDKLGNRTKLVRKDTTGDAAKDATVTQTFGTGPNTPSTDPKTGGGTGGPHALMTSTETSTAAGTKVTSYTYDATGNTASITSTPGTKTLTWNAQGKLDKITGTGESAGTSYLYGTGGNQLIRRDPGSTTLNLGSDQITLDTASSKVSNVRTYGVSGGLSVTRTTTGGTSTLTYQGSDHHGTGGVQFAATDLSHVRRHSDPFGNERGTAPAPGAWAGDKGFVGGTKEKSTGFTLLGAREYDPTTGRFISPDPIIDAGDPQQWNAYAYSNNSPINASDPSGLLGCEDADDCHNKRVGNSARSGTSAPPLPLPDEGSLANEVSNANNEVTKAKQRTSELKNKIVNLIGDLIGYNDARDCFTKGDVMACINTALGTVPWGKVAKAVKNGIKAFQIYKDLNKAYDAVHAAERTASRAAEALTRGKKAIAEAREAEAKAAKAAKEKAGSKSEGDSAGTESKSSRSEADTETQSASAESRGGSGSEGGAPACQLNSFPTGTRVLMADGSTKAMEDIQVGDKVMATDPQTGKTSPKEVTNTITTPDDKEFTDLTLTDDANPRGPPAVITSTYHHPSWSETRHRWVDAGEIKIGEKLRQPNGATLTVQATRNYPFAVTTHNLTVDDVHTYYVLAGPTPVLVHNCPSGTRGPQGKFKPTLVVDRAQGNWDMEARISDASALRDQVAGAATGAAKSRTYTAAVHRRTGDIAVSCSGNGSCAEPNILNATGWAASDVIFTRAMRREDVGDGLGKILQEKEICTVCQGNYGPDNFVSGVLYDPAGSWMLGAG